jgi:hypothetical protein
LGSAPSADAPHGSNDSLPAEKARIRFALDDARAGGLGELPLPDQRGARRSMRRELTTLAAAEGVTCVALERPVGARISNLARVVLALLLELGDDGTALALRHGLDRSLPLALISGIAMWDRYGHDEERARLPEVVPLVARRLAAFFLDAARRRPISLIVDRQALRDPLAAAVVVRLRCELSRRRSTRSASGGFLLAV